MREIDFRRRLGRAVAAARQTKGLAQERLAEQIGISRNELSLVERGELTCSVWIAFRLADGLGVGLDTLVARIRAPPSPAELRLAEAAQAVSVEDADRAAQLLAIAFVRTPEAPRPRPYPRQKR